MGIIKNPALGMFKSQSWEAAGRMGIRKQFALLTASRVGALVHTGLNVAMWAPMVFQGVMGATTAIKNIGRSFPRQELGDQYRDSQGAYTERQRSVRAITSSRLSARSAIGQEAMLLHR